MHRIVRRNRLASLALALFLASPLPALCQTPAHPVPPAEQPVPSAGAPAFQPTPEEAADALMAHQRYQAAIEAYKKAPLDSPGVWNKMGIAYQMMFNSTDAARCYRASLKIDPRNSRVLNNLGTVYDSEKDFRGAEQMYRKALRIDPRSAIVLKNYGTNQLAQHHYKRGWDLYQMAIALDPAIFQDHGTPRVSNPGSVQERGAMNYYMAKGCVRAGQNDCAIEYLRMALNEGFTNPKKIAGDAEFSSLRDLPAFKQLLAAQNTP